MTSLAGAAACTSRSDGSVCCVDTGLTSVRLLAVNTLTMYGSPEDLHAICSAAGGL
jgi:hypothetical protein